MLAYDLQKMRYSIQNANVVCAIFVCASFIYRNVTELLMCALIFFLISYAITPNKSAPFFILTHGNTKIWVVRIRFRLTLRANMNVVQH